MMAYLKVQGDDGPPWKPCH